MKRFMVIASFFLCATSMTKPNTARETVDLIFTILNDSVNSDYIGERISQLEHALQAAQGARDDGSDDETIAAALLHDIGHLCADRICSRMGSYGVDNHQEIGAQFVLQCGFSNKVAELIRGHVEAKRYLTYKDPGYYDRLSRASQETLRMQGGPMTQIEADKFEQDPLFQAKLCMRRWDEQAKSTDWIVADLETYRSLLLSLLGENV